MSKKRIRQVDALDLLSDRDTSETSVHAIDAQLFGAIKQSDANRQSASPVIIHQIRPDTTQPRRAVPYRIRAAIDWQGDPTRTEELFVKWESLVNDERERAGLRGFRLADYLEQNEIGEASVEDAPDLDRPENIGPLERALVNLVELATSIASEGLTNPITVVRIREGEYQIETGERRWLAYHLLYLHTGDERFAKIAARTVDAFNIWRQAAENNARSNLNAISKARQFAVLLMALLTEHEGHHYKRFEEFEHERMYYAQVADGEENRIPRGSSERLLNATGLKSGKQLREYRALLRLPREVWEIADDLNWPERVIRDLVSKALNEADLVQLAAQRAAEEGYTVSVGTVTRKKLKSPKNSVKSPVDIRLAPGDRKFYIQFLKVLGRARAGEGGDMKDRAFTMLDDFRRWLDEQEAQLRRS